ncbi:oxysterol-binding protein-related protein 8 isoform X4 [Drosophila sulfurigaster albostrigata]|uniref:oxysterol-binding protein-related protein 8 isoform X4 n=1 Tax=Drosophila sulfurigaster albostrigata TaxID=89887 RepID=UPI002D218D35|nr:oxysterol-binding protein-related protein 8 isoform X4 [Drosophila sulfurigaster albostrigata]
MQQQLQQQQQSGVATPSSGSHTPVNNAGSSVTAAAVGVSAGSSSSTPIRIGSAKHAGGGDSLIPPLSNTGAAASSHSVPGTPQQQPQSQSSSVPTATGSHLQLQNAGVLSMAASNQSLAAGSSSISGINITPPNSAGLRQSSVFDFKFKRRPSQKVLLTKLPSTDSLSNSPAPSSPGIANWASDNRDGNLADKSAADAAKLNRKESYKAQRKNYRREKKRVASELMNSLQDPAVIVLADWLKVRGTLKSWTKLWCVLKPGLLLIYKSQKTKSSHWVGTVMLTSCQVIERPSKKDGFCFKLFHPLEQSIWAPRGPDKETIGAVVQPLPTAYLIFRAPSQAAGKCWMDALELSLRCSALLLRSNSSTTPSSAYAGEPLPVSHETQWSEADYEKHFNEHDLDADSQTEAPNAAMSGLDTDSESEQAPDDDGVCPLQCEETPYVPYEEEEFGAQGEQVEELADENKSLIWCIVKQVRPGMDLSKVVLPTFILEPRSFLDKLSDTYYHADLLSKAVRDDDAFNRMKLIVQWYLSGFYKKPKGLKKPYNPILGETFRCYWEHPNGSRTFYIAEQVSHHPPVSAFYVTNREDGFSITCSILAKSKFYGNSTSAVLEGTATMTLLPRNEMYTASTPYAHCKGILMGTLSMELGGKINIECENTGYKTELEFKLKPFLGGSEATNVVVGKIKFGKETLATIQGHWDKECRIKDLRTGDETVLFKADNEMRAKRLTRHLVPMDKQLPTESARLWHLVSEAIANEDQVAATNEKTVLEEAQRAAAKERAENDKQHQPALFELDSYGQWVYKYADLRPWNPRNDVRQYECDYKVLTQTRVSETTADEEPIIRTRQPMATKVAKAKNKTLVLGPRDTNSDSSQSPQGAKRGSNSSVKNLALALEQVNQSLENHTRQLNDISRRLERMQYQPSNSRSMYSHDHGIVGGGISQSIVVKSLIYALIGLTFSLILRWLFK